MPLYLTPPKVGRTPFYRLRGSYLGIKVDRSTETSDRRTAQAFLARVKEAIERGSFSERPKLTFAEAAMSYMQAGGEKRFLAPVLKHIGLMPAEDITQADVDGAAVQIYPRATPATRNRQVYTPVLAVLKHAKVTAHIDRPKGALGTPRSVFLTPDQFEAVAKEAMKDDAEFGILVTLLCYTGLRISEALKARCDALDMNNEALVIGRTKNGLPRAVHLPPRVMDALAHHPRKTDRGAERLFRWSKSGELYLISERVFARAGVNHGGAPFHIYRHTYGAWLERIGGDHVATGAWKSETAARVYRHLVTSEEARKADNLPGAKKRASNVRKIA